MAGALGIQLGGPHVYHGELIEKPTIGEASRAVEADDIQTAISLLYTSTMTGLILFTLFYLVKQAYF